ncbi:hypothetical protein ACI2L1_17875 [Streptomyces sp. NPDC019531]|uniref:hypothetical protein n=1 Tax=Streptomyces sp. NPDC019531 TaxID=3365062 RepID=UPI00384A5ECF
MATRLFRELRHHIRSPAAEYKANRCGPRVFGDERCRDFLAAAHRLPHVGTDDGPNAPVEAFFRVVDELRRADRRTAVSGTLDRLAPVGVAGRGRPRRVAARGSQARRAGAAG